MGGSNRPKKRTRWISKSLPPAHGATGVKADLGDVITYMETMRAEVLEGIESGLALAQIQDAVLMEDYSDWLNYDSWRTQNVQGWYDYLVK